MTLLPLRRSASSLLLRAAGPSPRLLHRHLSRSTSSSARAMSAAAATGAKAPPPGTPKPVPGDDNSMLIQEGQASMIFPKGNEVFYNKVQVLNRDLSIMMLRLFAERRCRERAAKALKKEGLAPEAIEAQLAGVDWAERAVATAAEDGIVVLDALAASGLRSIRYFKEVPGVKRVVVNDLEAAAVAQAHRNVAHNNVDPARVCPQQGNAVLVMHQHAYGGAAAVGEGSVPSQKFDVVDLDPYGSAAPFIDAAVQAVADGGLLCVTCTDLAVLNGNHPEVCFGKYRSMPTKGRYMHEMSVRTVLHALESSANRYRRHIVPLLSVGIDFYLRVFVRVYTSAAEVKKAALKTSLVYQSMGCGSFYMQPIGRFHPPTRGQGNGHYSGATGPTCPPQCPETGSGFRVGGPIWSAPMHDMEWVLEALRRAEEEEPQKGPLALPTRERMVGLLTAVSEELQDVPLHYTLPDLSGTLHCTCPKMDQFKAALINAGYRVSNQHKEPTAIKTDAPPDVVWDIMRCWVQKYPVGDRGKKENSAAAKILAREPALKANFSIPPQLLGPKKKVKRFPPNPEAFWGPKARARSSGLGGTGVAAQGKRPRQEEGEGEGGGGGGGDGKLEG